MTEPLLPAELLARLERLQLSTRRRLSGFQTAQHRSVRHGTSLDFADYRQYHPGDDFRRIDYNLYARLDVLALKLFEAEDDITVRLLIDTSASMVAPKLDQAVRAAAAVGWIALCRRDAVVVHTFTGAAPARFRGRSDAPALFAHLERLVADGDTRFVAAASDLLARPGPRGMTVLVSDLMTPEWEAGLARLPARGSDVSVIHVLDRAEIEPDLFGDVELVDAETGRGVPISVTADVLKDYRKTAQAWLDDVSARCRYVGASYIRLFADDPLEDTLVGGWRAAGTLK